MERRRVSKPRAEIDPLARILADPDHSEGESREIIVGHSSEGRILLVMLYEREHPAVFSQRSDPS